MAYSAEVMKRARARLAQEKADRESENRQHLQQAYAQVPRLLEIDKQLRQNMALAVQAVFMKDGAQDLLEQAKEKNFALQQERDALAALHFEEGYLDESPVCSICGGTGYIGSSMCSVWRNCAGRSRRSRSASCMWARRASRISGWNTTLSR